MATDLILDEFRERFRGNFNVWGGNEGKANHAPITDTMIRGHLDGTHEPIGVYPIVHHDGGLWVRWGCGDIDTGDWQEAWALATALRGMGLNPQIERSRSKGWHVWIFVPEWITAREMRRCFKVAYKSIDLQAKEANPKSEILRPNQIGNYVRLPYPSGMIFKPERQVMLDDWTRLNEGTPMTLTRWVNLDVYSDPSKVIFWSSKWFEPERKLTGVSTETVLEDEQIRALADRLPKPMRVLWETGPIKADRSATLQALGYNIAKLGITPSDCFQLLKAADAMWGKYHQRADGDGYLADIVERSYR